MPQKKSRNSLKFAERLSTYVIRLFLFAYHATFSAVYLYRVSLGPADDPSDRNTAKTWNVAYFKNSRVVLLLLGNVQIAILDGHPCNHFCAFYGNIVGAFNFVFQVLTGMRRHHPFVLDNSCHFRQSTT